LETSAITVNLENTGK